MQKISTECDACRLELAEGEVSKQVRIDDKMYDLCLKCHHNLMAQLEGKGRAILALNAPFVIPNVAPFYTPPQPQPWNPPVHPLPGTTGPYIGDPMYPDHTVICGNVCQGTAQCKS